MNRFQLTMGLTALLGLGALLAGRTALFGALAAIAIVLTGLGVAVPRMKWFGPFICQGSTRNRSVALTFDDGPDARSTPALLDLLRTEGVSAAFFCVGQKVEREPGLAKRIVREGHLLENHSFTHSHAMNFFSLARLKAEMEGTQGAIHAATGVRPKYFRPPIGLSNPRVFRAATACDLNVLGWSARGFDTQSSEVTCIVRRIVRGVQPGGIVLLHDGNIPADRLVATVKLLLSKLHERGYAVQRLDQLLS